MNFLTRLFKRKSKKENFITVKDVEVEKVKKLTLNKVKSIRKKSKRNSKKQYATTKSFNDKKNDFKPDVNNERENEAQLYLNLVKRKKLLDSKKVRNRILRNKYGKVMDFKTWKENRFGQLQKIV